MAEAINMLVIRYLSAMSAAMGALVLFLQGYPGDLVPQSLLLIFGGISVATAAFVAVIAKPAIAP